MLDRLTPGQKKALIAFGMIVYVCSPLDLIPDFVLGLGQCDDLAVIFYGLKALFASPSPQQSPPPVYRID